MKNTTLLAQIGHCLIAAIVSLPHLSVAQENPPTPDIASPDIKESVTYDLGDHLLTVQRVTEETLPPLPPLPSPPLEAPAPAPLTPSPERLARIAAMKHIHRLYFDGTIYQLASGHARSLIALRYGSGVPAVEFWSSINWNLMKSGHFTTPAGETYVIDLMLMPVDIAKTTQLLTAHGKTYTPPKIPSFSAGPASYQILSGNPSAETLALLNDLHAIHDRDYESLLAAWQAREEERKASEAAAKLPQPPPADIVTQYREMTPEELENR